MFDLGLDNVWGEHGFMSGLEKLLLHLILLDGHDWPDAAGVG